MWSEINDKTPENVFLETSLKTADGIYTRKMLLKKQNNRWYSRSNQLIIAAPTHYKQIKYYNNGG